MLSEGEIEERGSGPMAGEAKTETRGEAEAEGGEGTDRAAADGDPVTEPAVDDEEGEFDDAASAAAFFLQETQAQQHRHDGQIQLR